MHTQAVARAAGAEAAGQGVCVHAALGGVVVSLEDPGCPRKADWREVVVVWVIVA